MITLSENFSDPTVTLPFLVVLDDDDEDFDLPQALSASTTTRPTAVALATRWIRMLEPPMNGQAGVNASAAPTKGSFLTESGRLSPFGVIRRCTSARPSSVPS